MRIKSSSTCLLFSSWPFEDIDISIQKNTSLLTPQFIGILTIPLIQLYGWSMNALLGLWFAIVRLSVYYLRPCLLYATPLKHFTFYVLNMVVTSLCQKLFMCRKLGEILIQQNLLLRNIPNYHVIIK